MLKQYKSICLTFFVIGTILISLGTATVTITPGANVNDPVCPSPTTTEQNLNPQSSGSSTSVDYTATSSFYDYTNSEPSQIMVKNGDASNEFKFVYFDNKSIKQEATCTGTTGFTFVKLINNMLFLKKTTPEVEFHLCQFNPALVVNSVTAFTTKVITLPTGVTAPITKFIPYSVRETTQGTQWDIYIAVSDASTTVTAKYLWTTISSASTVITSTITTTFATLDGIEDVIYTDVDGFAIKSGGAYVADTATLPTPAAGSVVRFYRTLTQTSVIGVYATDLLSATFYLVKQGTPSLQITTLNAITSPSTSPFVDFFDDSSNVIFISSSQVVWINVGLDASVKKVFANTTQISTTNLNSIGFLGTSAVFTYTDKLVNYEITGDDALTKTFSHSTTTPIVLSSNDYQKIYALSCFCRILRAVTCFSSTLNCLFITKGTANCPTGVSLVPS